MAASATPRIARGRNKEATKDPIYRAQRRGASTALRDNVASVVKELKETGTVRDPVRQKLVETRKAVVDSWMRAAEILDRQGEISLAGDVRYFVKRLPPVLTERERIATGIIARLHANRARKDDLTVARAANQELVR